MDRLTTTPPNLPESQALRLGDVLSVMRSQYKGPSSRIMSNVAPLRQDSTRKMEMFFHRDNIVAARELIPIRSSSAPKRYGHLDPGVKQEKHAREHGSKGREDRQRVRDASVRHQSRREIEIQLQEGCVEQNPGPNVRKKAMSRCPRFRPRVSTQADLYHVGTTDDC
jgi:hypothetical protein